MRSFKIGDGLKTITRCAGMIASLPVFGLRPILWRLLRTTKDPKKESLTASPRSRQSVISLRTSSTSLADSVPRQPDLLVDCLVQMLARNIFPRHRGTISTIDDGAANAGGRPRKDYGRKGGVATGRSQEVGTTRDDPKTSAHLNLGNTFENYLM